MSNCKCEICTTPIQDFMTMNFVQYLLGYKTVEEYDKLNKFLTSQKYDTAKRVKGRQLRSCAIIG